MTFFLVSIATVALSVWIAGRELNRPYLATQPTPLNPMTTDPKPPTYLAQVFDSKLFAAVITILSLAVIYTGSLVLFADWDSYEDPFTAQGSNRFVFIACGAILTFCFLIPLFKKSYRDARKGNLRGGY